MVAIRNLNSGLLRQTLPLLLCLALVFGMIPATSHPTMAFQDSKVPIKSASQFRSEAAQYDRAVAEIGKRASMRLDTATDLQAAVAILNKQRAFLKLAASKLVAMGLDDRTFTGAITKRLADEKTAVAFAKELNADMKAILKLDGAPFLQTRMQQGLQANAATLRAAADRLKQAAEKQKPGSTSSIIKDVVAVGANVLVLLAPIALIAVCIAFPPLVILATPLIVAASKYTTINNALN